MKLDSLQCFILHFHLLYFAVVLNCDYLTNNSFLTDLY